LEKGSPKKFALFCETETALASCFAFSCFFAAFSFRLHFTSGGNPTAALSITPQPTTTAKTKAADQTSIPTAAV
jgi:hypothetical protein